MREVGREGGREGVRGGSVLGTIRTLFCSVAALSDLGLKLCFKVVF